MLEWLNFATFVGVVNVSNMSERSKCLKSLFTLQCNLAVSPLAREMLVGRVVIEGTRELGKVKCTPGVDK